MVLWDCSLGHSLHIVVQVWHPIIERYPEGYLKYSGSYDSLENHIPECLLHSEI